MVAIVKLNKNQNSQSNGDNESVKKTSKKKISNVLIAHELEKQEQTLTGNRNSDDKASANVIQDYDSSSSSIETKDIVDLEINDNPSILAEMAIEERKKDDDDFMNLVEVIQISKNHPYYHECDQLSFAAKNLYNKANYYMREAFFLYDNNKLQIREIETELTENQYISEKEKQQLMNEIARLKEENNPTKSKDGKTTNQSILYNYNRIDKRMQIEPEYGELPAQCCQQILRYLDLNWKSFFKSIKDYWKNKDKYMGKPKIPAFKPKENGRATVFYTNQGVSTAILRDKGIIKLSKSNIEIKTRMATVDNLRQVRIVPSTNHYAIEIVYRSPINRREDSIDKTRIAAIDVGVNNLATMVYNFNENPLIINGRPLKSINQFYNQNRANYQQAIDILANLKKKNKSKDESENSDVKISDSLMKLEEQQERLNLLIQKEIDLSEKRKVEPQPYYFYDEDYFLNRIKILTRKRNNKIADYLHKASLEIVEKLIENKVSCVVIGRNLFWKQGVNIGKQNNQNFVGIPQLRLIEKITYKCQLNGIQVIEQEESYTSQASFLDGDSIPVYEKTKAKKKGKNKNNTEVVEPTEEQKQESLLLEELKQVLQDNPRSKDYLVKETLQNQKTHHFSGKRLYRGLYVSKGGIEINADVNAAYNILVKAFPDSIPDRSKTNIIPVKINPRGYILPKKTQEIHDAAKERKEIRRQHWLNTQQFNTDIDNALNKVST